MNDSRPWLVAEANIFSWHAQARNHLEVIKQAWAVHVIDRHSPQGYNEKIEDEVRKGADERIIYSWVKIFRFH